MAVLRRLGGTLAAAVAVGALANVVVAQETKTVTMEGKAVTVSPSGNATVVTKVHSGPSPGSPGAPPSARPGGLPARPGGPPGKPGEKKPGADKGKPGGEPPKKDDGKKDDATGNTVERPTEPPKPPDPKELKVRPDAEGKIAFNFKGQPWADVLQWLADCSNMSLDWQELPGGFLNLTTQERYELKEARDIINRHLLERGFTMLHRGELLSVVNLEKLNPAMVPRVAPEELAQRSPHEFVKVSFRLNWLVADKAAEEFKPMSSRFGKLTPLTATNRLEAIDAVINLREIYALLAEEQSDQEQDRLVRVFPLKYTRATDVCDQVRDLLGLESKSKSKGPKGPMTPQQMEQAKQKARMAAQMAAQQGKKPGAAPPKAAEAKVNLVANRRNNSILAVAPPDKMAVIAQAIDVLDVASARTESLAASMHRVQVYRLETIDPDALVKTLEENGDLDPITRLEVDEGNRAIIAYAALADHVTIRTLIDKLDGSGRKSAVIQLARLRAEAVVETIDFMMGGGKKEEADDSGGRRERSFGFSPFSFFSSGRSKAGGAEQHSDKFRISADVKNNALVLWANEFELAKVEDLLESLRAARSTDGPVTTVKVYRLVAIDPEPLVKTLQDLDELDVRTTLEVDEENKVIIANATQPDHETIRSLIEKLDGTGRQFAVKQLRRLEADYVAGTIEMMMGGGEKKEKYESRYDYYPYTNRMRPQSKNESDTFRVDADVEYNRLLLWANEVELAEVEEFLVKLGEIPSKGGDSSTLRIIDASGSAETDAWLEQIRRQWEAMAPNQLELPPPQPAKETPREGTGPKDEAGPKASPPTDRTTQATRSPFRFVQLSKEDSAAPVAPQSVRGETAPVAEPTDSTKVAAPSPPAESPSPAAESPATPAPEATTPPAPITISWLPDGRLIIQSADTKALDRLEELMMLSAPPRRDYEVFHLKYAMAYWVQLNLEDFFKEEEKDTGRRGRYFDDFFFGGYGSRGGNSGNENRARLSKRRPLKFISDSDSNTILVQGADPGQLKTIGELIELYDKPEPPDSQSVRQTEVFQIRYSKARVVAEAVKEVYRDLLSTNDKALNDGRQQQKAERSYTYVYGDGGSDQKMPRFKGALSIGVDELSNTLIVSAPSYLFLHVAEMIQDLDEAAMPVESVQVVKVGSGVSAELLREKLSEILGERSSRGRRSGRPPGPPPGQKGPPRPPGGPPGAMRR